MKPLLVFAMKEESQAMFDDYDVLHTQIGKVNATHALTKRIYEERPDVVLNLGTAGSRKHDGGQVINPTQFVQRDMDVTPLGFELFQTPFSDDPVVLKNGVAFAGMTGGVCGSGDNFDISEGAAGFDVVDMEAYALALVCAREDIPFGCLKYISDGADENAHEDWTTTLQKAAASLRMAVSRINF